MTTVSSNFILIPSKWFSFSKANFKLKNFNFPRFLSKSKSKSQSQSTSNPNPSLPTLTLPTPLAETAFRHLDADGDGKISSEELRSYFASIGESMTFDDARRVIEDFDGDGDEMLEIQDFVRLVEGKDEGEDDLRRAFEMFEDRNQKGCGFITALGLQQMFNKLGYVKSYEECMAMIRVFDLDGDGVIDYREFLRMMA